MSTRGAVLLAIGMLVLGLLLGMLSGGITGFIIGQGINIGTVSYSERFSQNPPSYEDATPWTRGSRRQPSATPVPRGSGQQPNADPTPQSRSGQRPDANPSPGAGSGNPSQPVTTTAAFINTVNQDGPAAKAGLQAGDIVTAVDGTAVDSTHSLSDLISAHKPGDPVKLAVTRGTQTLMLNVTLGQSPRNSHLPYLGVSYSQANEPAGNSSPLPLNVPTGAVITTVEQNSPAAHAGVQPGDIVSAVEGTAVDQTHSLSDLIGGHNPGDQVKLAITRGTQTLTLNVTLGQSPQNSSAAFLGVRFASITLPSINPQRQPGDNALPNG